MVSTQDTHNADVSAKARRQRPGGGGLGTALGVASVALGVPQVAAPAAVARLIGLRPAPGTLAALRGIGVRELAAAAGVLASPRPAAGLWSRVAGDALDLTLLGRALRNPKDDRRRLAAALAAVAGITALDVVAAARVGRPRAGRPELVAASSITVNRPADEVYAFWHDFANLPRFMAHLESV